MTSSNVAAVALEIASWFNELFSDLETLGADLTKLVETDFRDDPPYEVTATTSAKLRKRVIEDLAEHTDLDGAGLIFPIELQKPGKARLEWWIRAGREFVRQKFNLDPTSGQFYDYEILEWWQGGYHEERRAIAGPYIDHLGVDDYIVTMTVPAYANGKKIGVAGKDMVMREVETKLLRMLSPLGPGTALLNRHNSVIVGNTGALSTGILVAQIPQGYARTRIDSPGLDLSLIYRV
ncbi:cache domain-containing protein [Gulosibacter molinativorax]|uniref:Uncharacterized protein n=1 Tax=Gulosibacter molinativorax TaxID=256821 RepID=A0ABT7C4E6_9MICO|nr:cache domain-containing protein [Gulosibacter molinativorax]MDJ1370088.1 hypothetical protein [Gulosibacter molinativorax]QUY63719.1 Hypotetical protein [Gulosibacter molinativorax]